MTRSHEPVRPTQPELPPRYTRLIRLAERDPRRAAHIAQRLLAADPTPWAHYALGVVLLRWERLERARTHLAAAAAADPPIPDVPYMALLIRHANGEGVTLQADWAALVGACLQTQRWSAAARALNEQIAHLNTLGRHDESHRLAMEHAELVATHGAPADQARFAHVVGVAAGGRGDLPAAHAGLDRAAAAFRALRRPVDVARVRFERSWLHQRREDYAAARAELEAALATFQRFDLPIRIALCRKDLAILALHTGDYGTGLAHIAQARTAALQTGRPDLPAYAEHTLGAIAQSSGLGDLALAAYGRAEALYRELGQEGHRLMCLRNSAMVLCAQDRSAEALALLDTIAAPLQTLNDQFERAEWLATRGRALRGLHEHAAALQHFEQARAAFQRLGNEAAADECLLDAGWLYLAAGQPEAAARQFSAIGAALRAQPAHRWRADFGLGQVAEQQGDPQTALDHYYAAGAAVATMRRRLASEHASSALFVQARQLYTAAIRLAARTGAAERVAAFAEQQRALLLQQRLGDPFAAAPEIHQRREDAREHLQAATQGPDKDTRVEPALQAYIDALLLARHLTPPGDLPDQPFDLRRLRERLNHAYGADWSLLAPILAGADLHLLMISPTTIDLTTSAYDATLRGLLARTRTPRLRSEVYRDLAFARGAAPRPWHDLQTLAERLLPPALRERLHPAHRLLITPGGPFHALPWAALRLPDAWLAEQAIIQYVPTLMPNPLPALDLHGPGLLVGCATFGGRAPDLPSAIASLDAAATHWPGPTIRIEEAAATRAALLNAGQQGTLRQAQLLHIAGHAVAGDVSGLLGHVLLADANLWVDDITRLNLGGGLVVLAACAGAAGEVLPGDELLGVGRAFLAAGATGVLASFWPIYDQTVLPMIEGFYAALTPHADPARALAAMQRRLIADTAAPEIMRTPYIWACFGYTGMG